MKHVAAYMLCVLGGNKSPTADDVKKILTAVNAKVDETCLAKVMAELKGKDLDTIIKAGEAKFAQVGGGGGGGGGAVAAAAPAAAGKAAAPAKEEKKKAPEPEEEEMSFDLFG